MLDGNHPCHELEFLEICNLFSSPIASLSMRGLAWSDASPCTIAQTRGIHSGLAGGLLARTGNGWLDHWGCTLIPCTHRPLQRFQQTGSKKERGTVSRNYTSLELGILLLNLWCSSELNALVVCLILLRYVKKQKKKNINDPVTLKFNAIT